jgi:hypothetical protein
MPTHSTSLGTRTANPALPPEISGDVGITATVDGKTFVVGEAWCTAVGPGGATAHAPAFANARLWSAAEDLLAVCTTLIELAEDTFIDPEEQSPEFAALHRAAKAAVAKAAPSTPGSAPCPSTN